MDGELHPNENSLKNTTDKLFGLVSSLHDQKLEVKEYHFQPVTSLVENFSITKESATRAFEWEVNLSVSCFLELCSCTETF